MKVARFVPCYIDAFFPEVGIATVEPRERLGCERRPAAANRWQTADARTMPPAPSDAS
jgi:hypothetical protein